MNPVNIRSKAETRFAIAVMHSPSFKKGRRATKEGRKLYNQEVDMVEKYAKKYDITLHKPLKKMKV